MLLGSVMKQDKSGRTRYAWENHEHDVPPAPSGFVRRTQHWAGYGQEVYTDATNIYPGLLEEGGWSNQFTYIKQTVSDALPRERIDAKRLSSRYSTYWRRWDTGSMSSNPNIKPSIVNGISFRAVFGIKNLANFEFLEHQFYSSTANNTYLEQGADGFKFRYDLGDTSFTVQLWRDRAIYETHQFNVPLVDDHVYAVEVWGKDTNWKFRLYSPSLGQGDTKESNNVTSMKFLSSRILFKTKYGTPANDPEQWAELWFSHSEQVTHPFGA